MDYITREERIQNYVLTDFKRCIAFGDVKSIEPDTEEIDINNEDYIDFVNRHIRALFELLPVSERIKTATKVANASIEDITF